MRLPIVLLAAGAALHFCGAAAYADPLSPALLPVDTRWVLHADVDSARAAAPLWDLCRQHLFEPRREELAPRLQLFVRVTGMRPADDLKDVTLFGNGFDATSACIRIHGAMDKEAIIALLKPDPEFHESMHGTHQVISWHDKGQDRLLYASFASSDVAYLTPNARVLEAALDTLDKTAPSLAGDSPLLPARGKPIFWMAGTNLSELPHLQKVESPVLAQMDAASLGVRWEDDKAIVDLQVTAKSDKAAQQLQSVAEGAKALVQLAAADEHAPSEAKLLGAALAKLAVTAEGKDVRGEWSVGLDKIESLFDLAQRGQTMPVAKPAAGNTAP